ncbi:1-aminocyclopropane-1-carboxylate oxidase 1-like protein [Corchorus olitorius]|uniref:1-aminocyclopropane-1-carboxylate oxidase 1-like protein n=1 Tax=Corchorus olitorius TaxID=93759 RepID=A0A1R3I3A8_9ROSI|nr:1-aminocyclopropane-1-carboxylate oxidase 1-like protein [Corchorus olitorius]
MRVCIYDEILDQIQEHLLLAMIPRPVLVLAGMLVNRVGEDVVITSCFATNIYVNLEIQQTMIMQQRNPNMSQAVQLIPANDPPAE